MKKKVIWMVMSGWMVAALLLTSCAPAVVDEEAEKAAPKEGVVVPKEEVAPKEVVAPKEEANMVKWTKTKLDGTVFETMIEKPRYGGQLTLVKRDQPVEWDQQFSSAISDAYWNLSLVQESLLTKDWARSPVGTGEWGITARHVTPYTVETGLLAESWERPEPGTLIFHIRQGVHWGLDPTSEASRLVGGREMTATDVAWYLVRAWTHAYPSGPWSKQLSDRKNPANSIYVSPTDKWAVVAKGSNLLFRYFPGGTTLFWPPEVMEKYGEGEGKEMSNWRHVVGTGPFMIKDYVLASSVTYVRNPNYWGRDPFFPENQLPYPDGVNVLIIPDQSTAIAAMRVGKIDTMLGDYVVTLEEAQGLWKTDPQLEWAKFLATGGGQIYMRTDTKPFDDIRVRQALHMAINNQELKDSLWQGEAEIMLTPISPQPEWSYLHTPLGELSPLVQELYGYHPEKARQLLAEAGYPDGFVTEIITPAPLVDIMSVVKQYWAKIGVDLKIEVRDFSVWKSIGKKKTHTQLYAHTGPSFGANFSVFNSVYRKDGGSNFGRVVDPMHPIVWEKLIESYFDPVAQKAILTEPMAEGQPSWVEYINTQTYDIILPQPYQYRFWQPWLKGHGGANSAVKYSDLSGFTYVWIDQELKKAMAR